MSEFYDYFDENGEFLFKIKKNTFFDKFKKKAKGGLVNLLVVGSVLSMNYCIFKGLDRQFNFCDRVDDFYIHNFRQDEFRLDDLGDVDFSRKHVEVDVFFGDTTKDSFYFKHKNEILSDVREFYSEHNIELEFRFVERVNFDGLEHTKRFSLEFLKEDGWFEENRKVKKFPDGYGFIVRYLLEDSIATGNLGDNRILVRYQQDVDSFILTRMNKKGQKKMIKRRAKLLVHEIGHMFGLYHSHQFLNDIVDEFQADSDVPNAMSYQPIVFRKGLVIGAEFNEFQDSIMHSYLSKGKVYEQLEMVDFDYYMWLNFVEQENRYVRESNSDDDLEVLK